MPKAATESTGASMRGRITSNTAANNMSIGIGRNTYVCTYVDIINIISFGNYILKYTLCTHIHKY